MLERSIRYALERRRSAKALRKAHDELELRVQERTAELRQANEVLRAEIAERQRAEQKLRDTERLAAVGTTAAKLVHEIGNPLNGLSTTIQVLERHLIKRGYVTDDLLISTVHDLKNETNRLQSLLQELRVFARPQQLDCQPTDVALVAAEVLRTQAQHYTKHGIYVEQLFPLELPLVMADSEKLAQVLLNLCKNAVEAMPEGGTLTVRGFQSKAQVCIEIQDTGHGVSGEVNVFEPFVTTKPGGTGLGLAIVRQIVEVHGGTITYTSTSGQGTTFTLALPVAASDVA
jgi:signal transduction histidine kinase